MSRKNEIIEYLQSKIDDMTIILQLVDEMVFIEEQLFDLRKLPMVKIHPKNKTLIKATPASKLYKEFLQQYNYIVKNINSMVQKTNDDKEDSPLRKYFKEFLQK